MKFIDSHAHITPRWFENPPAIIEEAKKSLTGLVLIGLDPDEYQYLIDLVAAEPEFIRIAFGISPSYVHKQDPDIFLKSIESMIVEKRVVNAVGEIGLDFYRVRDKSLHDLQEQIFIRGIHLANEHNIPLVIHSRAAEARSIDLLARHAKTDVLLHCFGDVNHVVSACDNGFYISIPTAVTYRNEFQKVAQQTPLDRLLIETDSPFLSPIRGKRQNTPMNVEYAAREVAKIKGVSISDVALTTTKNAQYIFWRPFK